MQYALYHPGDKPINPDKIASLAPDWVILDLEESVPSHANGIARNLLGTNISRLQNLNKNCVVRINSLAGNEGEIDLEFLRQLNLSVPVLLPKPIAPDYLAKIAHSLRENELWVMGEEIGFGAYCKSLSKQFARLTTVVIGSKDLSQSLSIDFDPQSKTLREATESIRELCQSAGLAVFDGVAFGDPKLVQRAATNALMKRFDGMTFFRSRDLIQARSFSIS